MPLVMTSGNVSDEPIAYRDDEALERLGCDRRPLPRCTTARSRRARTTRCSARCPWRAAAAPLMLRRSRGYVPDSLGLPVAAAAPVLACGAELKSTFCVAKERPRLGRPPHRRPRRTTRRWSPSGTASTHFERLFAVEPRVVAHDLHPGYLVHRIRARARGRRARRRAAPPRPPRRRAGRARRAGAGDRRDLRRHRLRRGRHRLGRRAAVRRPARLRAGRSPAAGAPAGRRAGDPPAVAHGVRLAGRGARRAAGGAGRPRRVRRAEPLGGGARAGGDRHGVAAHDQHGTALRRRCGALRHAHAR